MAKKIPTIWPADAHTLAKIEILRFYLDAWFPILANSSSRPILYVDGFAGPGRYANDECGSPIAALETLGDSMAKNNENLKTKCVTCAFIEADSKRYGILNQALEEKTNGKISIRKFNTIFVDGITALKTEFPNHFNGDDPLFVFADPFGGTDTPLETFRSCMAGGRSELLINLDADGIARIYDGKNNRFDSQLDEVFGGRCWEEELGSSNMSLGQKASRILHLYKRRIKEVLGVKYVFEFEMRGRRDKLNYYLVFATNHPLGMERMKEAMSKVDQNGRYCFSDADQDQEFLFSDRGTADYAAEVRSKFIEKEISYEEVECFCLCETPAKTAGILLRDLEERKQIELILKPGIKRRKGTFQRDKIERIRFPRTMEQGLFL